MGMFAFTFADTGTVYYGGPAYVHLPKETAEVVGQDYLKIDDINEYGDAWVNDQKSNIDLFSIVGFQSYLTQYAGSYSIKEAIWNALFHKDQIHESTTINILREMGISDHYRQMDGDTYTGTQPLIITQTLTPLTYYEFTTISGDDPNQGWGDPEDEKTYTYPWKHDPLSIDLGYVLKQSVTRDALLESIPEEMIDEEKVDEATQELQTHVVSYEDFSNAFKQWQDNEDVRDDLPDFIITYEPKEGFYLTGANIDNRDGFFIENYKTFQEALGCYYMDRYWYLTDQAQEQYKELLDSDRWMS